MVGKKRVDIELMRIIACFFVIFNHTGIKGYFLFSLYDVHSIQYWIYMFISIFCKLSVPLFFMISGTLTLERQSESIPKLWFCKIFHICFIIGVWSFFYYMLTVKEGNESFNIYRFFSQLYDNNWNYSFWYLYAYLSFLISLPLLQRIAQSLLNKEYVYMISLYIIFNMIIPILQYLLFSERHSLNGNISVGWLSSNIVIFPLMGYFLSYRIREFWNKKRILMLWIVNIATILLSCYLTYYQAKITGVCDEGNSQKFHNMFVLINSMTIFVTCQYLNDNFKFLYRIKKPIFLIGRCTFGIYLLHIYLLGYTKLAMYVQIMHMPPMLSAFCSCGIVLMCGFVITVILKKIPFLNKLVS